MTIGPETISTIIEGVRPGSPIESIACASHHVRTQQQEATMRLATTFLAVALLAIACGGAKTDSIAAIPCEADEEINDSGVFEGHRGMEITLNRTLVESWWVLLQTEGFVGERWGDWELDDTGYLIGSVFVDYDLLDPRGAVVDIVTDDYTLLGLPPEVDFERVSTTIGRANAEEVGGCRVNQIRAVDSEIVLWTRAGEAPRPTSP